MCFSFITALSHWWRRRLQKAQHFKKPLAPDECWLSWVSPPPEIQWPHWEGREGEAGATCITQIFLSQWDPLVLSEGELSFWSHDAAQNLKGVAMHQHLNSPWSSRNKHWKTFDLNWFPVGKESEIGNPGSRWIFTGTNTQTVPVLLLFLFFKFFY